MPNKDMKLSALPEVGSGLRSPRPRRSLWPRHHADALIPMALAEASHHCEECGAMYMRADDSCQARFDQLLALDHSHREPWGSRHALAFAAFALQHPRRFPASSVARSHEMLERVCMRREPLDRVVADYRQRPRDLPTSPPRLPTATHYAVTIADLGAFDASTYPDDLMRWALAALGAFRPGAA
ncbi:MAG: DUF5946 family protein [Gemmatimonadales bacterium]